MHVQDNFLTLLCVESPGSSGRLILLSSDSLAVSLCKANCLICGGCIIFTTQALVITHLLCKKLKNNSITMSEALFFTEIGWNHHNKDHFLTPFNVFIIKRVP